MEEFECACRKTKLKQNIGKSNIRKCLIECGGRMDVRLEQGSNGKETLRCIGKVFKEFV